MGRNIQFKVNQGLADPVTADIRHKIFARRRPQIEKVLQEQPELALHLQEIKTASRNNLSDLVEQAVANMRANGIKVFRAATNQEAMDYLLSVIDTGPVVKSKSNAVKEIGLINKLAERNVEVIETDLGDRICQLGNIPAAHPLGPAVHVPIERVAQIFSDNLQEEIPPHHEAIVMKARESLREYLISAPVGLTGANAISADTGSIVLTENEGNIRAVTNMPRKHVVVAGVEKMVATLEDALHVVKTAAAFGTGQDIGAYVSVVSGPSGNKNVLLDELLQGQGPEEVHVVLLEQGRWEILGESVAHALACINCGHCLRVCPVFAEIGENFGTNFFGGIGVLHSYIRYGLAEAVKGGLELCMGCGRCKTVCPNAIPTDDLIKDLRKKVVADQGLGWKKSLILKGFLTKQPLQKLALSMAPIFLSRNGDCLQPKIRNITSRKVPLLNKKPFLEQAADRVPAIGQKRMQVGYFVGCLNNLTYAETAMATVVLLNFQEIDVLIPKTQNCCGLPLQANGDFRTAEKLARNNLQAFNEVQVDAVIYDCASCGKGFEGYPSLFQDDPYWRTIADGLLEKTYDLSSFLLKYQQLLPRRALRETVTYHSPCHLKQGVSGHQDRKVLQQIPSLTVKEVAEDTCCGFGGTFNLQFHRLSGQIAERKMAQLQETDADMVVTSCPGCRLQLSDGLHRVGAKQQVVHLSELLLRSFDMEREEM